MHKNSIRQLCLNGLFIALVCVATMAVRISVVATNGYIHLGDSVILICSIIFGRKTGMIAGGIGSALADILSGYAHWAVFTLIIKGLMGYVTGLLANDDRKAAFVSPRNTVAALAGEFVMVVGYFIFGIVVAGFFIYPDSAPEGFGNMLRYGAAQSLLSVAENLIQAAGGLAIAAVLGLPLKKALLTLEKP